MAFELQGFLPKHSTFTVVVPSYHRELGTGMGNGNVIVLNTHLVYLSAAVILPTY